MVIRRFLPIFLIWLVQQHSAGLLPNNCTCKGKSCNCSSSYQRNDTVQRIEKNDSELYSTSLVFNKESLKLQYPSEFNLDHNFISKIEENAFKDFEQLKKISMCYNLIHDIPSKTFSYISNLEELYLRSNVLWTLHSDLLANNSKLEIFDVSDNKITIIPPNIFRRNSDLKEVYLNNNKLSYLSEGIFRHNPLLAVVHLENNKLSSFQPTIFRYSMNLYFVNVSNNEIIVIENSTFKQNCKLKHLDFTNNKLRTFQLCQSECQQTFINIHINGNSAPCTELVQGVCPRHKIHFVGVCDGILTLSRGKQMRWKRAHLPDLQDNSTVRTSKLHLQPASESKGYNSSVNGTPIKLCVNSSDNNENLSAEYNETCITSVYEDDDLNMTTMITLIQYNSPLVVRESTMRGFLFIGIECSIAGALILKKVVSNTSKREPRVPDTIELLSDPEPKPGNGNGSEDIEMQTHSV